MRCVVLLYIVVCRSENFRFDFREILSWLDLTLANYVSDQFKMKFHGFLFRTQLWTRSASAEDTLSSPK